MSRNGFQTGPDVRYEHARVDAEPLIVVDSAHRAPRHPTKFVRVGAGLKPWYSYAIHVAKQGHSEYACLR